jgi:hypothetical protein
LLSLSVLSIGGRRYFGAGIRRPQNAAECNRRSRVSPRIVIADDVIIYTWRAADTPCDPKTDPKLNDEDFILEENVAPTRTRTSVEIFSPHVVARFFTQPSAGMRSINWTAASEIFFLPELFSGLRRD